MSDKLNLNNFKNFFLQNGTETNKTENSSLEKSSNNNFQLRSENR